MTVEKRESIEQEFFDRWVFQEGLYEKYLEDFANWTCLDDNEDDEVKRENIVDCLPTNINVENLVAVCIGYNALVSLYHSRRDKFFMERSSYLVDLLIDAELVSWQRVKKRHKEIFRETEDLYDEMC